MYYTHPIKWSRKTDMEISICDGGRVAFINKFSYSALFCVIM